MAREFSGTGQYLSYAGGLGITSADTFWVSIWAYFENIGATHRLLTLGTSGTNNNSYSVEFVASTTVRVRSYDDSGAISGAQTATVSTGAWTHILARYEGTTVYRIHVNGGSPAQNTVGLNAITGNPSLVRLAASPVPSALLTGRLAYVAVFDGTPSAQDIIDVSGSGVIANAKHPTLADSAANLIACWDLDGDDSPEPDSIGSAHLTLTGSPTQVASPGIILPGAVSPAVHSFWWM